MTDKAAGPKDPADQGRSSAATIARILAGAEAEFGSKGLDGAKIDDIARAAGISKQLIYHYFSGKDDLYSEMLLEIAFRNMTLLSGIDYAALEPIAAMRAFIGALFQAYADNPFASVLTVDQILHSGAQIRHHHKVERLRDELYRRLDDVLARGRAAGAIRADIDVPKVHFLAIVLVTGMLTLRPMFERYTQKNSGWQEGDVARVRADCADYFERAIAG